MGLEIFVGMLMELRIVEGLLGPVLDKEPLTFF